MGLRCVKRRVVDPGCEFCRELLAYTVVDEGGQVVGEVRQVRLMEGHPRDHHYGVDWEALRVGGIRVQGWYGFRESVKPSERFVSRQRALEALERAWRAAEGIPEETERG